MGVTLMMMYKLSGVKLVVPLLSCAHPLIAQRVCWVLHTRKQNGIFLTANGERGACCVTLLHRFRCHTMPLPLPRGVQVGTPAWSLGTQVGNAARPAIDRLE